MLKKRNENDPFLKRLITGDEKWVIYNNIKRKRSWSRPREPAQTTSKAGIHQKKFCYQFSGITKELSILNSYHPTERSILLSNDTLLSNWTTNEKTMQLKKSGPNWQIEKVLYSIITMQGHTSLVTRQKLLELGWDFLPHPPYSPDLAPSDYFLFRSLQNSLNDKNFNNDDDIKSYLIQFFANKNQKFYEHGIMMLPERWQKVIHQNGQHITE